MREKLYSRSMIRSIWRNCGQKGTRRLTVMECPFTEKIVKSVLRRGLVRRKGVLIRIKFFYDFTEKEVDVWPEQQVLDIRTLNS